MEFLVQSMNEQIKTETNINRWRSGKGMMDAKCRLEEHIGALCPCVVPPACVG